MPRSRREFLTRAGLFAAGASLSAPAQIHWQRGDHTALQVKRSRKVQQPLEHIG